MTKSHVRVFVRTRPVARPFEGLKVHKDGETITLSFPKDESSGLINNQLDTLTLKYDGVLENVSQESVYNSCVHDAVDRVLAGYNATIFCYGQTGAGKTFTMSGDPHNYAHRGVVPRALHQIFREVDLRTDKTYKVHVSYMEIHNETLYDLLSDNPAAADNLAILDDANNTVVRGLTKVEVRSEEEALSQFFLGEQGRSTAVHVLNSNSSRSHVLFSIYVETRTSAEARERALLSKLHLVDLAGSERTKKTNASGDQLREASAINKSLTFLEQVVNALARKDAHVPFRQSKLTAALRDALGGNCKTVMIANLWPEPVHLDECASTLRFAARVRCLETAAVVNESSDPGLALARAERQIKELKQELAMRDMLSGRGRIVYEDLSESEQLELQQLVLRYLSGSADVEELPADSLKRIKETYKAFKALAGTWAAQAAQGSQGSDPHTADGRNVTAGADNAGVGDVDPAASAGFCIGTAPVQARPAVPLSQAAAAARASDMANTGRSPRSFSPGRAAVSSPRGALQQQQQYQPSSPLAQPQQQPAYGLGLAGSMGDFSPRTGGDEGGDSGETLDRNALFSKYKHSVSEGRRQSDQVRAQQQQVNDLKQQIKDLGSQVNSYKAGIDSLSSQLAARKAVTPAAHSSSGGNRNSGNGEVLDNEQYVITQQLKAAKANYRTAFDNLKELRAGLEPAIDSLAAAKEALLVGFDTWVNSGGQQLDNSQKIGAWRGDLSEDGAEQLDPTEAFDRMDLARKAATAGDPDSAAYFAAKKQTGRVLGARLAAAHRP